MECQLMRITSDCTENNGYGENANINNFKTRYIRMWSKFYNLAYLPSFEEAASNKDKYEEIHGYKTTYLNKDVYIKRIKMTILPFLLDCNNRAKEHGKMAYIRCVGLGLGVWEITSSQTYLMAVAYDEVLSEHTLNSTSDIDFSWFNGFYNNNKSCGAFADGIIYEKNNNNIKIHVSKSNPADPLDDKNKELFAM